MINIMPIIITDTVNANHTTVPIPDKVSIKVMIS